MKAYLYDDVCIPCFRFNYIMEFLDCIYKFKKIKLDHSYMRKKLKKIMNAVYTPSFIIDDLYIYDLPRFKFKAAVAYLQYLLE